MGAPKEILQLVQRFDDNVEAFRSPFYNETNARIELIDPFFKALGWDINNQQGFAEAYKDVVHEDAIKVGGAHKAPDYCFRVGGTRKFFLEAKIKVIRCPRRAYPSSTRRGAHACHASKRRRPSYGQIGAGTVDSTAFPSAIRL